MSFEQTVLLSLLAGLTIFLGLPVGRLRNLSTRTQALLTTAAAGVILFLIWDILAQAVEPVEEALDGRDSAARVRPATSSSTSWHSRCRSPSASCRSSG